MLTRLLFSSRFKLSQKWFIARMNAILITTGHIGDISPVGSAL